MIDLDLGKYWENFIQEQVASGRFETENDVIIEAVRFLEERSKQVALHKSES